MNGRRRIRAVLIGGAGLALLVLLTLLATSRVTSLRPGAGGAASAYAGPGDGERGIAARAVTAQPNASSSDATPDGPKPPVFAGPGPDDPAGPGMLPHPITAEHKRIYRDVELLDGAWQALKSRDFERARALLNTHATEYASGYDDMQDGLTVLADCMQYPSATSRERAERFYTERTASSMRRRIRTHCLQTR